MLCYGKGTHESRHQSSVASQQLVALVLVETSKLVVTAHFATSLIWHDQQRIFDNQPNFVHMLSSSIHSATAAKNFA